MRKIKFEKGQICHIFNRGIEKRSIFMNDADKWRFLQMLYLINNSNFSFGVLYEIERKNKGRINFNLLQEFVNQNKNIINREPLVRIMADCLMPNHFHLLLQEIQEGGISEFMQRFGTGYTKYFNAKYDRVGEGGLFQGPYKVTIIKNDIQLQYVLAYINVINPGQLVEPNLKEEGPKDIDNILNFAENYSFSTNPEYLGLRESIIIDKGIFKDFFPTPEKYEEFIRDVLESKRYNQVSNLTLE